MLLLVEQLPFNIKAPVAEKVADHFWAKGRAVRLYSEFCEDNPIRINWKTASAAASIASIHSKDYPYADWSCLHLLPDTLTIIEARLIQASALFAMLNGEPLSECIQMPGKILESLSEQTELKIILSLNNDPQGYLDQLSAEKINPRINWLYRVFAQQKWFQEKNLSPEDGMKALLQHWQPVYEKIIDQLPESTLILQNPEQDWTAACRQAIDYLEADCVNQNNYRPVSDAGRIGA